MSQVVFPGCDGGRRRRDRHRLDRHLGFPVVLPRNKGHCIQAGNIFLSKAPQLKLGGTHGSHLRVFVCSCKDGGQVGDGGIRKVLHSDEKRLRVRASMT